MCVEAVGYLLEELRNPETLKAFKADVESANIFIGSLIFVQVFYIYFLCCASQYLFVTYIFLIYPRMHRSISLSLSLSLSMYFPMSLFFSIFSVSFVSLFQYLSRRSLSSCPSLKFFLQMSVLRRSTTFFVCVGKRLLPQPSQKKKHD